jgi:hypothetical protein
MKKLDNFGLNEDEEDSFCVWAQKAHSKINEIVDCLNEKSLKSELLLLIQRWEAYAVDLQKKHELLCLSDNISQDKSAKPAFISFGVLGCCKDLETLIEGYYGKKD